MSDRTVMLSISLWPRWERAEPRKNDRDEICPKMRQDGGIFQMVFDSLDPRGSWEWGSGDIKWRIGWANIALSEFKGDMENLTDFEVGYEFARTVAAKHGLEISGESLKKVREFIDKITLELTEKGNNDAAMC